jgi:HK97 family phage major capsid protein
MIEDSAFPVLSWASGKFTETVDLLYDNMVLNGTGVGQPHGILKNPGATDEPAIVVSGNASLLTADGLLDLAFTVPEQYDDNSVFVMNKTNTAKAIAKLKDGQNRYLWGDGLQDSGLSPAIRGRALAGYPVIWSGFAPNIAANAFPVVFGDLRGYFLVQRVGMSVQVLRELYAETNQVLLLGRIRFGGIVAEPFRLKVQKVST